MHYMFSRKWLIKFDKPYKNNNGMGNIQMFLKVYCLEYMFKNLTYCKFVMIEQTDYK